MADRSTILVRVSGPDGPGITAGLMRVLDGAGADVHDVEQVVVRRRLTLALVVDVPEGHDVLKELLLFAWERGVGIDFEVIEDRPTSRPTGHVVTVMAAEVTPAQLGAVAEAIAGAGGNIDRIVRLARRPVWAYELAVGGGDADAMRTALVTASAEHRVDVAVQRSGLGRRATRLVVMDLDSTLIRDEVIDLLAEAAGCLDEVAVITRRAMAGELDFEAALRARIALLAGMPVEVVHDVRDRVRLTPGARTFVRTLRRLGYKLAVISGGFDIVVDAVAADLGLDHACANVLEVRDGRVTGEVAGPIVDRPAKARLLEHIAAQENILLEQTVAIGDGANDIDMLATAGLGIAFNAKPVVREVADTSVSVPYLDAILFLLGVPSDEVDAADDLPGA